MHVLIHTHPHTNEHIHTWRGQVINENKARKLVKGNKDRCEGRPRILETQTMVSWESTTAYVLTVFLTGRFCQAFILQPSAGLLKNTEKKEKDLISCVDTLGRGPAGSGWRLRCEGGFVLAQTAAVSLPWGREVSLRPSVDRSGEKRQRLECITVSHTGNQREVSRPQRSGAHKHSISELHSPERRERSSLQSDRLAGHGGPREY